MTKRRILEMLRELLAIYLQNMGAKISDSRRFRYYGKIYQYTSVLCMSPDLAYIGITLEDRHWLEAYANVAHIDPCDPSFDPNVTFEPIKRYLEAARH